MSQRPDFVMVGGQSDGMFYLIASKTLTEVELRVEVEYLDTWLRCDPRLPRDKIERQSLTAEMRDYVTVIADSYAEAFRTLFECWAPTVGDQRAIAEQPALIWTGSDGVDWKIGGPPRAIGR